MTNSKRNHFAILGLSLTIIAFAAPPASLAAGSSMTVTQTVNAELIAPLTLANAQSLNFGQLIKNFSTGSQTVKIAPTGGIGFADSSDPSALIPWGGADDGMLLSTGEPGELVQVYSVPSFELVLEGATTPTAQQKMTVSALEFFVQSLPGTHPNGATFTYPASGSAAIETGGTLTVNGDNELGVYSGSFDVTIAYQ